MSKKKSRAQYTSKGQGCNVNHRLRKSIKRDTSSIDKLLHKRTAFNQGKTVMLTVDNPNKTETGKPFIRVNAKEIWKKSEPYMMKTTEG